MVIVASAAGADADRHAVATLAGVTLAAEVGGVADTALTDAALADNAGKRVAARGRGVADLPGAAAGAGRRRAAEGADDRRDRAGGEAAK